MPRCRAVSGLRLPKRGSRTIVTGPGSPVSGSMVAKRTPQVLELVDRNAESTGLRDVQIIKVDGDWRGGAGLER